MKPGAIVRLSASASSPSTQGTERVHRVTLRTRLKHICAPGETKAAETLLNFIAKYVRAAITAKCAASAAGSRFGQGITSQSLQCDLSPTFAGDRAGGRLGTAVPQYRGRLRNHCARSVAGRGAWERDRLVCPRLPARHRRGPSRFDVALEHWPGRRQINKLKLIKRSMYGRASLELLRARIMA
jgi:hypothetical protein